MLFELWLSELAKQGGRYGFFFGFFDSEPFVCLRARWDAVFENHSLLNLTEAILLSPL